MRNPKIYYQNEDPRLTFVMLENDIWFGEYGKCFRYTDKLGWVPYRLQARWTGPHDTNPFAGTTARFGDIWVRGGIPLVWCADGFWVEDRKPLNLALHGGGALPGDFTTPYNVLTYVQEWESGLGPYHFYWHRQDIILMSGGIELDSGETEE